MSSGTLHWVSRETRILAIGCLIAGIVGYLLGPKATTESTEAKTEWRSILSSRQPLRIAAPSVVKPSGWPALREMLADKRSGEMPELLGTMWERLSESERETWIKAGLIHWLSMDPDAALTFALESGDDPLGRWLKKTGVPFAFDRWARIAPLEAIAFLRGHRKDYELYNISFGNALRDLPSETLLELLLEEDRVLGSQHAMLEARFRQDPELALALLVQGGDRFRGLERDFAVDVCLEGDGLRLAIEAITQQPKADWIPISIYSAWASKDSEAAIAHWKAHRKDSPETLIATIAANDGPEAIMSQLATHNIEPTRSSLLPMAKAMGQHPVPVSKAVSLVDGLIHESYDPLQDTVRFHDIFPRFKWQLNESGWPPEGEALQVVDQLMEMPGSVARDALLGAVITAIGENDLEVAVSLAAQASEQGAHWVFENLRSQLTDRFDLQLEIGRSIEGAELEHFFMDQFGRSVQEEPLRLAEAIASAESNTSSKILTWHLMKLWTWAEPDAAQAWLNERSASLQQWGEAALASDLAFLKQYQEAADRLLAFESPFREQDLALRGILRRWSRRDHSAVKETVARATHWSADYREKLMNYVNFRERYKLP